MEPGGEKGGGGGGGVSMSGIKVKDLRLTIYTKGLSPGKTLHLVVVTITLLHAYIRHLPYKYMIICHRLPII